jgi:adenylate cyclase
VLLTIAGFLIVINLFTGPRTIWFHWPVAALLFIVVLRTVARRRSRSDREEGRRRDRE